MRKPRGFATGPVCPTMDSDEAAERNRRTVLKAAGGLTGISALAGVAAAADGDDPAALADDAAGRQQQGQRVGMVSAGNLQVFAAPLLWVPPGTPVTWVAASPGHSTTAYAPGNDKPRRIPQGASAWDSGVLSQQGATFRRTFDTAGVYDYYCVPHEAVGMVGRLVVGSPNLQNQPALDEPQQSLPMTVQEILRGFNTMTTAMFGGSGGQ